MLQWIFWDNDGVLVDTEHLYFQATREILATIGIGLTEVMYVELFLVQSRGAWHLAAEKGMPPDAIEGLRRRRAERYSELLTSEPILLPDVHRALERLRGRLRMGVVTSSQRAHFDLIHQRTGLLPLFDFVLASDDCRRYKPDPEPYLRALEKAHAAPQTCLAIEDSLRGLAAAKAAGLECWVIPSRMARGCDFSGADRVLGSIREVEERLLSEGRLPADRI